MTQIKKLSKYEQPLVWLDIEASGLDPEKDDMLELAFVVTTPKLFTICKFQRTIQPSWAVSADSFKGMPEWCLTQHTASGLIDDVLQSQFVYKSISTVEAAAIDFLANVRTRLNMKGDAKFMMCGRNVHFDHTFLKKQMPELANMFGYQYLDITTLDTLALMRYGKRLFDYKWPHRALPDVEETIEAAQYYNRLFCVGSSMVISAENFIIEGKG